MLNCVCTMKKIKKRSGYTQNKKVSKERYYQSLTCQKLHPSNTHKSNTATPQIVSLCILHCFSISDLLDFFTLVTEAIVAVKKKNHILPVISREA